MKRACLIAALALLGLAVGIASVPLHTAFMGPCEKYDNCEEMVGYLLGLPSAGLVTFGAASLLLSRRGLPPFWRAAAICATLAAVFLVPAAARYVYELRAEYQRLSAVANIEPSLDFSHAVIATRPVQGFTDASDGPTRPIREIPRWERCLVGTARCDSAPRQIEMQCRAGVLNVNEPDWPAFARIPDEDLPGISPLKFPDMCDE